MIWKLNRRFCNTPAYTADFPHGLHTSTRHSVGKIEQTCRPQLCDVRRFSPGARVTLCPLCHTTGCRRNYRIPGTRVTLWNCQTRENGVSVSFMEGTDIRGQNALGRKTSSCVAFSWSALGSWIVSLRVGVSTKEKLKPVFLWNSSMQQKKYIVESRTQYLGRKF